MTSTTRNLSSVASSLIFFLLTVGAAFAQTLSDNSIAETADPARWYQEDLTPQARFQTAKKEVDAAYKEAAIECKKLAPANRSSCVRDARTQWAQDLESAKKKTLRVIP